METPSQTAVSSLWYSDWQNRRHAELFDARARLGRSSLIRNYEVFNDVRLLAERMPASRPTRLLEVGCATGEFCRYLGYRFPLADYTGVDISQTAVQRAKEKYPQARFYIADPARTVLENFHASGVSSRPQWIYSKDVLHHQVNPWSFLEQLLDAAEESVILRTRTRDRGPTVLDPDLSCQYHYSGWMPYLVLNLDELVEFIHVRRPDAEMVLIRNRMVLGGCENRFLPKECYLPETGTAETAMGVFLKTDQPGRTRVDDREDMQSTPRLQSWLKKWRT